MSDVILNIVFALVAVGFAVYSYKKNKKSRAIGFLVLCVLVSAYAYKLWAGM